MCFENWSNHLDSIKNFYESDFFDICCLDDNIVSNLFYGYITAIGEDLAGQEICDVYYGENSNFWIDYLIEDFIKYGYALVPIIIKNNRDIPEIESELDYTKGIKLDTKEELYNFIKNAILPNKKIENIDINMAIRRNSG